MKVILLDIEGTTTPVDFVYKTLFPYARKRLDEYLKTSSDSEDIKKLKGEYENDSTADKPDWDIPPIKYLYFLMDNDIKSPALKSIQGKIWKEGYGNGALKGELFSDVVPAIKRWNEKKQQVAIYSSGSVLAQKLLFKHSQYGDISKLIDGYFDTGLGPKKESGSYTEIAKRLKVNTSEMLFVSDSAAECEAAQKAGCDVRYSVRPGNKVESVSFKQIESFEEL